MRGTVNRSLAALQAFAYVVHFAVGRIRQAPDVLIVPSSFRRAQPISVGKLLLPRLDASKSITAILDNGMTVLSFVSSPAG